MLRRLYRMPQIRNCTSDDLTKADARVWQGIVASGSPGWHGQARRRRAPPCSSPRRNPSRPPLRQSATNFGQTRRARKWGTASRGGMAKLAAGKRRHVRPRAATRRARHYVSPPRILARPGGMGSTEGEPAASPLEDPCSHARPRAWALNTPPGTTSTAPTPCQTRVGPTVAELRSTARPEAL